jgi:hypothetical protein
LRAPYRDTTDVYDGITIEPGKMGATVYPWASFHGGASAQPGRGGLDTGADKRGFPFIEAADIQQAMAFAAFSVREYNLPITRAPGWVGIAADAQAVRRKHG